MMQNQLMEHQRLIIMRNKQDLIILLIKLPLPMLVLQKQAIGKTTARLMKARSLTTTAKMLVEILQLVR